MPSIASDILKRFDGASGRSNLAEKLSSQYVLGGNNEVVNLMVDKSKLRAF